MRRFFLILSVSFFACGSEPRISNTTQLGNTYDQEGPYIVRTVLAGKDNADNVRLFYGVTQGEIQTETVNVTELEMEEISQGVYQGEIAGQPAFSRILYYVDIKNGNSWDSDPQNAKESYDNWFGFWVLGSPCESEIDCGPAEICEPSGQCRILEGGCSSEINCGKGFRCGADGECHLMTRFCTLDKGCLSGEVCNIGLQQCMPRPRCDEDFTCPLDFVCIVLNAEERICRRFCAGDLNCGPGETCNVAQGYCEEISSCSSSSECQNGLVCDSLLKLCRPQGAGLCATCTKDGECGGPMDFCLVVGSQQVCGQDCSNKQCPQGYSCSEATSPPQCIPSDGTCN